MEFAASLVALHRRSALLKLGMAVLLCFVLFALFAAVRGIHLTPPRAVEMAINSKLSRQSDAANVRQFMAD